MRLFIAALREDEWPAAINEVLRVAKPGGMIQLMEYVSKMYTLSSCQVGNNMNTLIGSSVNDLNTNVPS
ncbi:hypothetical protein CU097_005962 [Rhizopus azygosporus]|uniref:Methyltransferase type 11 domain-containing protein n=1 Tax=Rhizopus azygosporus TaxID=86630 RepID=A0A367KEY5_RHIAZ|nr:hypothetical protein CU097_005962 [Rhizopus azygosporus]